MNRKRLLLAALAGLLVLSVVYAFWAMPRQEKAPPRVGTPRPVASKPPAGKKEVPPADRLHLGLLAQAPQPFPGAERDIFRFHGGWAPLVDMPVLAAPPVEVAPPPPPPPPPTPEQILREKIARFTYLGFLDKGGIKTVFLSDEGNIHLVKAGDHFGKNKELVANAVTAKELVVGTAGISEVVRVQLIENERLVPAVFGAGQATSRSATGTSSLRPGGVNLPPRRILPQRVAPRPAPPPVEAGAAEIETQEQPPSEGVEQEEPPNEEAPGGEGNGN